MTYEEYEKLCKIQQEKNEEYLGIIERDLMTAGLNQKSMVAGCGCRIDIFLGYFFIHKCMWSTPGTIKSTAASIKKYYKCMNEHGYLSKDRYKGLCELIKENIQIWQNDCEAFNNY